MRHIRTLASVLAISAASSLTGCASSEAGGDPSAGDPSVGEAASAFSGMAAVPGGLLNARSGPGPEYPIAYQIANGQYLNINCYTIGSWYLGSKYWYQQWDGTYVLSAGVNANPGIPMCGGFGFGTPGGFGSPGGGSGWSGGGPRR